MPVPRTRFIRTFERSIEAPPSGHENAERVEPLRSTNQSLEEVSRQRRPRTSNFPGATLPRGQHPNRRSQVVTAASQMRHISFDQLLGGSVPSLQHLSISGFDYEGLPSLLSSAPNLISFKNQYIRPQCYLSPEEMIEALAGLTKLRELIIAFSPFYPIHEFRSGGSQSLGMCSQTHAVFPALTRLQIEGDNKYLENLINLINTP